MTSRSFAARTISFATRLRRSLASLATTGSRSRLGVLSAVGVGAALIAWPLIGFAQDPVAYPPPPQDASQTEWNADDVPAHIAVVDGDATLERDSASNAAEMNTALLTGDRLRTSRGRVEVMFADGSAIDLDNGTTLDFLSDSLLRLQAGRIRLSIPRVSSDLEYRVDAAGATATFKSGGDYRLTVGDIQSSEPQVDLAVLYGSADLSTTEGRTLVRAGTHAVATEHSEPSVPYQFNASSSDDFDQWVDAQRQTHYGATSSQYLPSDLRYYSGDFDQYGTWDYQPTYGYVWYPQVSLDWRPYSSGRWSFVGNFGWFWVGLDRWSWPTHHYGRWGFNNSRWFWIPDRRWSPAWVSWAYTNDYVSWCPLGFDNRPVISLVGYSRGYDPWNSWTVVPFRSFRPNVYVSHVALAGRSFGADTWSRFTVRSAAPITRGVAVSRNVQPLRSPTFGRSTPRGVVTSGSSWTSDRGVTRVAPDSRGVASSRGFTTTPQSRGGDSRTYATPNSRTYQTPQTNGTRGYAVPNGRSGSSNVTPQTWSSRPNPSNQSTSPSSRQADPRTYATPRNNGGGSWQSLPQNITPSRGRGDAPQTGGNSSFTTRGYWQTMPGSGGTPQVSAGSPRAMPRGESPRMATPETNSRAQGSPWVGRSQNNVGSSSPQSAPATPRYAVPRGGSGGGGSSSNNNDRGGAQSRGGGSTGGGNSSAHANSGGGHGRRGGGH